MPAISRRVAASLQRLSWRLRNAPRSPCFAYQREAIEQFTSASARPDDRERVVQTNRARVAVEQLTEIGLADPAIDPDADLDAERLGNCRRLAEPGREIDLPEAPLAKQAIDQVTRPRLAADEHLTATQQLRAGGRQMTRRRRAGGCRCGSSHHWRIQLGRAGVPGCQGDKVTRCQVPGAWCKILRCSAATTSFD